MIRASLSPYNGHFRRSASYQRLDSSEKGALSFFLGQAQAKLFAHDIFQVFQFVHYDKYLGHIGITRRKTRPDFIGFRRGGTAIAVEAKGRSGLWDERLIESAKKQVEALPGIRGYTDPIRYVHVAFFDRGEWGARLIDPPGQPSQAPADPALLTLIYYEPIVTAILDTGTDQEPTELPDGKFYLRANFPGIDAYILIRADIANRTAIALGDLQPEEGERPPFAASLLYELTLQLDSARSDVADVDWRDNQSFFLGDDGVGIELGSSWENWASP
jgi:hypothetical protein